jgi:hypothetical protein
MKKNLMSKLVVHKIANGRQKVNGAVMLLMLKLDVKETTQQCVKDLQNVLNRTKFKMKM